MASRALALALLASAQAARVCSGAHLHTSLRITSQPRACIDVPDAAVASPNADSALSVASPTSFTPSAVSEDAWSEREAWALEDSVPRYTVQCDRRGPLVLWRRLQVDTPELAGRSVDALRARWLAEHAADEDMIKAANADCPPCLEDWERLADGSYRGKLTAVSGVRGALVATVAVDPGQPLGSRAEAELWCFRSSSGDLFELGAPKLEDTTWLQLDGVNDSNLAGAPGSQLVTSLGMSLLGVTGIAAATAVGMNLFGHHVDVSVFIV